MAGQPYLLDHSDLESAGDLDGDGLEELVSTTHDLSFDGTNRIEILNVGFGESSGGLFSRSWLGQFPGSQIDSAVVDARPIQRQVLAPVPGRASRDYNAQIAVSMHETPGFPVSGQFEVLRLYDIDTDGSAYLNGSVPLSDLHGGSGDDPVPEIEPFALDGRLELGEPVPGSYTQLEPSVILNAPPTHFDILDGEEHDVNFCYQGDQYAVPQVCFFDSEYERESSASTEVTSESTEDWSVSAKATASFSLFDAVDIEAELRGGYGENYKDIGVDTVKDTVTVTVKARNTDKIYAIKREYDTLEYPVYAPGIAEPAQFVLSTTPHTMARQWIDSSSPEALDLRVTHQPGNILSYPEDRLSGENPFISPTDNPAGGTFADTFAKDDFELSDFSDYTYQLTDERMTEDTAATEKKWNVGATAKASGSILSIVDVSLEVSGDYSNSDLSSTKTTVGTTTKLTSTMQGIDESFGETAYTVKPFAYWTPSATLVLDYAVEPSQAQPGDPKTWWQLKYGSKPDLTLNLPRLYDFEEQAGISSDAARFISPGVEVLKAGCDSSDAACTSPCAEPKPLSQGSATTGESLCLRAQVQNYSLRDQTGLSTVQFYDADPDVGGVPIGSPVLVNPVTSRDSNVAVTEWTPDARFAASRPRIFAVVESGDAIDELHEDNNKGFRSYRAMADTTIALHAPQDVLAEPAAGRSIDVSWDVPDASAAQPPHDWLVNAYPESGGAPVSATVGSDERGATVTNLPPDRYRVAVFSVGGGESSPASHPAEPVTISTADPSAPTNLAAQAGNASVQLSWDPPQDTGGGPIDLYRIREFRSPGQTFPEAPVETTVAGDVTTLTLSGLTNGRPYRFTVQAVNGHGDGAVSAPSDPVTPLDVPDKPRNVTATAGTAGTAKVSWERRSAIPGAPR